MAKSQIADFASVSAPFSVQPISVRIPGAVALTGFSRSRIYELIATGELEVVKDGRTTIVLVDSLRAAIQRRRSVENQSNEG